jgi:pilus assembly protein CpaC
MVRGFLAMLRLLPLAAAVAVPAALVVALPFGAGAQQVLRTARGPEADVIPVLIDRAVVLESDVEFAEVSVANPEIADVQPISNRTIYIFGRRRGTTSLTLFAADGRMITNVVLRVLSDLSELKERLRQLLPGEGIEVRAAGDTIVLSGVVSGAAKIDKALSLARAYAGDAVVNMMSVGGTQQVLLKVKVAEINRDVGKDLGVSITAVDTDGTGPVIDIGENNRIGEGEDGETIIESLSPALGTFSGVFGAIFTIADSFLLDVRIDALEAKGFAKTLSEPNLISLSGIEANFLAGGEVPIPVQGDDGEVTVSFKPVGVNLNFLPLVLDNDMINVSVSAEVSQVDPTISTVTDGVEVVGFQTRRATTTVELRDGQAFAIAGLLQESFEDTISQVPWLGDIPVLGALFRSVNFQRGETELVIFVSVHLVSPVEDESELLLPTDRIAIPNEADLFLLGDTTGPVLPALGLAGSGIDGDYGYVLD